MPNLTRKHVGAAGGLLTLAAAVALASTSRPALAAPGPIRAVFDLAVPAATAAPTAAALEAAADRAEMAAVLDDSLLGLSGKLRARFVSATDAGRLESAIALARAVAKEGQVVPRASELSVLAMLPFSAKIRGRVGPYVLGTWPRERAWRRGDVDAVPAGFIQVTEANRELRVSEHFRLGDFVTKNQHGIWPKAMVLREPLVDKLELVIAELQAMGVRVSHMQVMSGFRTPAYNAQGLGSGRAEDSRHQYGDAADVFVDNDRDGRMDDLNRDGRVNIKDADVIVRAAERVEARNPTLVGGIGRYPATSSHGPFVHIDTRGHRARWG